MTKYKVTMTNNFSGMVEKAEDYVPVDILDDYVADARTRWMEVTISEEPDAGPTG